MAKFIRKGDKGTPGINTASLPDIVFMILMFFMVSTSMRQTDRMVNVKLPEPRLLHLHRYSLTAVSERVRNGLPNPAQ